VGFEPTEPSGSAVFKTAPFDRSGTPPAAESSAAAGLILAFQPGDSYLLTDAPCAASATASAIVFRPRLSEERRERGELDRCEDGRSDRPPPREVAQDGRHEEAGAEAGRESGREAHPAPGPADDDTPSRPELPKRDEPPEEEDRDPGGVQGRGAVLLAEREEPAVAVGERDDDDADGNEPGRDEESSLERAGPQSSDGC
jgi:hypothetical protein